MTLKEKINILKEKLNNMIGTDASYKDIYEVSLALDELIVEYYKVSANEIN